MRKTHWISLLLALAATSFLAGTEYLRGRYYLYPSSPQATPFHRLLDNRCTRLTGYFMQRAEWSLYDARFKVRKSRLPHPDIAIIAIDDASLKEIGQWPWSRRIHARLIRKLEKAAPKALIFDVFFIEPYTADPAGDKELISATRANPWVVHSWFFRIDENDQVLGVEPPMKSLMDASRALGYANAVVDTDGVLRRARPSLRVEDQSFTLLSVAGSNLYLGRPWDDPDAWIPRDGRGKMLVNFAGPEYTFPYISYADVLSGRVPADRFRGKIVLVGARATGTFDHYPTPTSREYMPGVEFHANVINSVIHGNALRYDGLRFTYLAIGLFGLFCGLLLVRFSAWAGALWALGAGLLYAGIAQGLFARKNIVIDMAGPLMSLTLSYVLILIYRFFTEEREKRWVKAAFGQYVSPKVLEILMDDPSKLKMVGDRRDMTVFFSDVAGFTSISERLNPDELVVLLNRYLSAMTEVVFENDGYLNKYMGDGIMAFWNAPVKQGDHADRACRCALKSKERLERLNHELESQGLVPLKARIGINTGTMVVGNMGSIQKSDYTVMGDNVNLASRLEGANKSFGSSIMISEFTYEIVQDRFDVRFLDKIRVPGKARAVRTYELLAEKGSLDPVWQQTIPLYHEAIQLFADRQFQLARTKFLEVLKILGHDKPCETYLQRTEVFAVNPPPKEWDGIFELKVK